MRRFLVLLIYVMAHAPGTQSLDAPIQVKDAAGKNVHIQDLSRVVSVGGDITEILYALNAQSHLVARDDTSYFPKDVEQLPSVGYMRTLSPEGILSVNPSLILATNGSGPPTTIKQIRDAGIPLVMVPKDSTLESVVHKIEMVAKAVGAEAKGKALIERVQKQYKHLQQALAGVNSKPKVLLLMNVQRASLMAAGSNTGADAMIRMAGGINAVSGFQGYKPISNEIAVSVQPDAIVVPSHGAEMMGGIEVIASMPELAETPAVKNKNIILMDSLYLLMFGPRFAEAAAELAEAIHPDLSISPGFEKKRKFIETLKR